MNMIKMTLAAILGIVVVSLNCLGCSNENATKRKLDLEARQIRNQRCLAQRQAIDSIVQDQMKKQGFTASKQDFAAQNWSTLFDSL